jgi:hypothetical protein
VKFDGQVYWREVESYTADIDVKVTLAQSLEAFDWKWIIGIAIPVLGVPSLWGYFANRKKKPKRQSNDFKSIDGFMVKLNKNEKKIIREQRGGLYVQEDTDGYVRLNKDELDLIIDMRRRS